MAAYALRAPYPGEWQPWALPATQLNSNVLATNQS